MSFAEELFEEITGRRPSEETGHSLSVAAERKIRQMSKQKPISLDHLTRVVVVRGENREEYWADKWDVAILDDGQTIKLFATGDGADAIRKRDRAFAADLGITVEAATEIIQEAAKQQGQPSRFKR